MPAGTITSLQIQDRDKERINLFIDEQFALGISIRTLESQSLYKGKVLDDHAWAQLLEAEQLDKAYNAALHFLAARPRSAREIRDRLRRKDYPDDHIDAALERLERLRLVDDRAFARWWIENRQANRPRGNRALQAELQQKGVDRTIISELLDELTEPDDEREAALEAARRVVRRYASAPDKWAFSRKLSAFLQRRGFGFDAIKPVVDELWVELHADDAES